MNRLTYTLCFFRASLLLTRALPVLLLPMYYRCITRASFILSPSLWCVCVCVLYITARALERVKMSLKIIQTDEIVRLVNVYFETVWDTPIPFQIESFFVFSFFCFFLFPFESCGIERPQSSGTQRRDERERERNKKKTTFFSLFLEEANTYRMQKKSYNSWPEKIPREISSRSDHEKTALCDCILSMYSFIEESSFRALSLSLLSSHHHTQY